MQIGLTSCFLTSVSSVWKTTELISFVGGIKSLREPETQQQEDAEKCEWERCSYTGYLLGQNNGPSDDEVDMHKPSAT